mmetsp:Transcript_882/g.1641  ORF Transcript_882/g.1641 Transcript_882/m.1641 type:complete len:477 (+) Transcript_882:254-1684(+)|eukprot:CAMPEP_0202485650 /NCGR_PEP_ID=MMETSP1361-20130828/4449_1 /ASSEMBLY_ACC=CAM_ASM_000849 /TAXON_ID=210615 /ORGANISM="Staurosira complex sp., Strain CCMP2646" /LENGTH=476 /DNA_ID=CAMNT_0049114613 /DNA_START=250 /DNA_END=1680 /DNA_ORIENTATION=+
MASEDPRNREHGEQLPLLYQSPSPPEEASRLSLQVIPRRSVVKLHNAAFITLSAVLNLVVATAGGIGMVTLPGSFASVGWVEGILLLVIAGLAAALSLILLNRAANITGNAQSYASLVSHVLGEAGSITLEALTLAYCCGQVVAYLGAIGGQVVSLLSYLVGINISIHQAIACVAFLGMFPLSLLPEAGGMRFAGVLGTACMMYIVLAVVLGDGTSAMAGGVCSLEAASNAHDESAPNVPIPFSPSLTVMLKNAPIFLFAMNASVTYVPVRYEQKNLLLGHYHQYESLELKQTKAEQASWRLIWAAILAAGLFYLSCSGVAYAAYCNAVPENVVDAWPLAWMPGLLARAFLAIELTVAAAGIYIPLGRAAFWHLRYGPDETVAASGLTRLVVTLGVVATGAIGSMALGGALTLPLAVTSALCVTAQMFVLPGLCMFRLQKGNAPALIPGGSLAAVAFAAVGAAFGALSLVALFGLL